MSDKFKEFVRHRDAFSEMAMGVSEPSIPFMVSQPMANLLSLIKNSFIRARALNWLTTEGLMKAAIGRGQLCQQVNAMLSGQEGSPQQWRPDVVRMKERQPIPPVVQPGQKVAGIGEVFSVYDTEGEDPEDIASNPHVVTDADLFSKEAWKRNPALATVRIEGKNIIDYYEEKYEPRYMSVEDAPGQFNEFNLVQLRAACEHYGLKPFRYGGFDGYLQYMEKGDYLPPEFKRSYSKNHQYGPDLRPYDPTVKNDRNNVPTYHFMGGPSKADERRSEQTILNMRRRFQKIATAIEGNNATPDMSPEEVGEIKNIINTKDKIRRVELGLTDTEGGGKAGAAANIFDLGPRHYKYQVHLGDEIEPLLNFAKVGLDQVFTNRDPKMVRNLNVLGHEWHGQGQLPRGSWMIDPSNGRLSFRLSDQVQARIMDIITKDLHQDNQGNYSGHLNCRIILNQAFRDMPGYEKGDMNKNMFMNLSTLFNDGVKANPQEADKFKRVFFTLKDGKQPDFAHKQDYKPIKIEILDRDDENALANPPVDYLWDKGYRWYDLDPEERKLGHPIWYKNGVPNKRGGVLALGSSRYRIAPDQAGNWYLYVPIPSEKEPVVQKPHGIGGEAMLAGGVLHSGGINAGHIKANVAGPKTWEKLLQMLMSGEMGEPGVNDPMYLDCITKGITTASYRYEPKHFQTFKVKFEPGVLREWGFEGLRAFSGDPAFQVGYITSGEMENIMKWDDDKLQRFYDTEFYNPGKGKGAGIAAYLLGAGIEDPQIQAEIIQSVMEEIRKHPIVDLSFLDKYPKVKNAILKNGYMARVRAVSNYVLERMQEATRQKEKEEKGTNFSTLGGGGEDESDGFDIGGAGKRLSGDAKWQTDTGEWGLANPQDILRHVNVLGPEEDIGFLSPRKGVPTPNVATPSDKTAKTLDFLARLRASRQTGMPQTSPTVVSQPDKKERVSKFLAGLRSPQAAQQPVPPRTPPVLQARPTQQPDPTELKRRAFLNGLNKLKENVVVSTETSAVYDPKVKIKDGVGFNWWGAVGDPLGVSVSGEVPTGKKGKKNGRKSAK